MTNGGFDLGHCCLVELGAEEFLQQDPVSVLEKFSKKFRGTF